MIFSRVDTAPVGCIRQLAGCQVNHKFHILFQDRIGVALRTDRYITHRWIGTDRTHPRDSYNIVFRRLRAATNHYRRQRIDHRTGLPVMLHIGLFNDNVFFIDLAFAIMASDRTLLFVDYIETGRHRFIIGDAFRIVAFYEPYQFVR